MADKCMTCGVITDSQWFHSAINIGHTSFIPERSRMAGDDPADPYGPVGPAAKFCNCSNGAELPGGKHADTCMLVRNTTRSFTCTRKHADDLPFMFTAALLDELLKRQDLHDVLVLKDLVLAPAKKPVAWTNQYDRPPRPAKKCVYVGGSRYCKAHDEWHQS